MPTTPTKPVVAAAGVGATVAVAATLAAGLLIGGSPTAAPQPIVTPTADGTLVPGTVAQVFRWVKSEGATGYRLYLDGVIIGNVPGTWEGATLSVKCGVKHRFNAQPFNNKGLAALAAPVYATPPCP